MQISLLLMQQIAQLFLILLMVLREIEEEEVLIY